MGSSLISLIYVNFNYVCPALADVTFLNVTLPGKIFSRLIMTSIVKGLALLENLKQGTAKFCH